MALALRAYQASVVNHHAYPVALLLENHQAVAYRAYPIFLLSLFLLFCCFTTWQEWDLNPRSQTYEACKDDRTPLSCYVESRAFVIVCTSHSLLRLLLVRLHNLVHSDGIEPPTLAV
jgi:hypothetical protein